MEDIINKTFGQLTVLKFSQIKKYKRYYLCQCFCGNIKEVEKYNLTSGHTKSCGCLSSRKGQDLVGKVFNKLTVLKDSGKRQSNGSKIWECQCDCGSIINVDGQSLKSGKTTSCGCLKSKGEEKISKILSENNIVFEKQKTFKKCYFPDTNYLAKFDFFVNNTYLIEFDGIQHFQIGSGYYDNNEQFKKLQQRDKYKNQWCKNNNILLIRIPYNHLDDLCLDDLIPERSNYVI